MSVLIKGMEMPTLYRTYKVRFSESGDGKIVVGIANEDSTAYRPIGEVISVPPHGRLIDADDVFHVLTSYYHHSTDFQHEALKEAVARVSTIIPAEEGK